MALPLLPIIAVVALIGLALSKKSVPPGAAAPSPGAATNAGIPSFPVAAGVLNQAAGPAAPPALALPPPPSPPSPFIPAPPTITLPPITIIGTPPASGPPPVSDGTGGVVVPVVPVQIVGTSGATAQTAPWDASSMILPSPANLPALSAKYKTQSQETVDIQTSLNNWGAAVGFQTVDASGNPLLPLATDGLYGHDTQLAAAGFQVWANATRNANLAVDGEAGPMTQTYLLDWGSITSGAY
jgi:hypothetical protein